MYVYSLSLSLSLSLSQSRCVFTACLSNKRNNDVNDQETIPIGILSIQFSFDLFRESKKKARVCVYIYIYICVRIYHRTTRERHDYMCAAAVRMCAKYSSLIRDVFFVLNFGPRMSLFLSLSLSLFFSLGVARLV